jgi:hypothetical protein
MGVVVVVLVLVVVVVGLWSRVGRQQPKTLIWDLESRQWVPQERRRRPWW